MWRLAGWVVEFLFVCGSGLGTTDETWRGRWEERMGEKLGGEARRGGWNGDVGKGKSEMGVEENGYGIGGG